MATIHFIGIGESVSWVRLLLLVNSAVLVLVLTPARNNNCLLLYWLLLLVGVAFLGAIILAAVELLRSSQQD